MAKVGVMEVTDNPSAEQDKPELTQTILQVKTRSTEDSPDSPEDDSGISNNNTNNITETGVDGGTADMSNNYQLTDLNSIPPYSRTPEDGPTFRPLPDNGDSSRPQLQGPLPPIGGDKMSTSSLPNGDNNAAKTTNGGAGGIDNAAFTPPPSGDGNGNAVEIEQETVDVDTAHSPPINVDTTKKPLPICAFIANRTKLAFFLFLMGHIFFIVISAVLVLAGYDLLPIEFSQVPLHLEDDDTYLRNFAWRYRDEDPIMLVADTSANLVGERTKDGDVIQIFFEGDNVLTRERLLAIQGVEDAITGVADWPNYCKQTITNGVASCNKPLSLLRFFDGSLDADFNDSSISNIPDTLYRALQKTELEEIVKGLVGKSAVITATTATSELTRTVMFAGVPLPGANLTSDSIDDQNDLIQDFIVDNYRDMFEDWNSGGVSGMSVYYLTYQLLVYDIEQQVIYDMMLAVGSFFFIFLFMWFQTGSLLLTSLAIFSIFTSFLGCNLIYRIVFDYRYFGIFHVLSIFIILGIGADNIFVFNDTWRATAHENHPNLAERLSSCYRRASKSMMNTSLTTFAAFISNALSPLMGVNTFGIFSATLVMVNFLSAIIFFPSVVMVYHKYWEDWAWPCCKPCRKLKIYPCAPKDESKTGHRPNAIVRFFGGPFSWFVTHKIIRWVLIVVCLSMCGVFSYFCTQTEISKQPLQLFRDGHNYDEVAKLDYEGFELPLDDRSVKVMLMFGLKNQDRGSCHKSDFKCKGVSVFDESFDMNPKPAQTAIQGLCETLRTMTGDQKDRLRLKTDATTGINVVDCYVVALNDYLVSAGNDSSTFNPTLDLSLPFTETKMLDFFNQRTNFYNQTHVQNVNFYRYFETMKSYWINNQYSGTPLPEYGTYGILTGESTDPFDTAPVLNVTDDKVYGTRLRYAAIEISLSLIHSSVDYEEGLGIYNAWEDWTEAEAAKLPPSVQGMIQFSNGLEEKNTWHEFKRQEALSDSAVQGIWFGIILAYIVLACATLNLIIALMATLTILIVTLSVSAFIPILGWEISVIESINLSLIVGLAVDYVVHLSEAYHVSAHHDRKDKVRDMLEQMGVSVLSGAFSTLGASSFMMGAQIQFFVQFGIFLFLTIGFSLMYSMFLFTPVMSIIGPMGHQGSVVPLAKWVWYKIKGRKNTDVDCKKCKGKGFHAPDCEEITDGGVYNGTYDDIAVKS